MRRRPDCLPRVLADLSLHQKAVKDAEGLISEVEKGKLVGFRPRDASGIRFPFCQEVPFSYDARDYLLQPWLGGVNADG